ncbi:MAG TPA: NAD(P)-dependent alcohol dehydrogenase, partial [Edaphobacter sp.]
MRVWRVKQFGLERLEMEEVPVPEAVAGRLLVRVHAVSLNYRDLMVVKGIYNPKMQLPRLLCSDGAGEVVKVGDGAHRVKVGDRVCGIFMQSWIDGPLTAEKSKQALGGDVDGMLAGYVTLDQEGVVKFPEHLSFEEAATLPCAGVTAWNALHHAGNPVSPATRGETVLIQGTGGVSIFALQFAKLMGAKVIGISSSEEKLKRAYERGMEAGCNYREQPEWSRWAMET